MRPALVCCVVALLVPSAPPRALELLEHVPVHLILHPLDECIWLAVCNWQPL